ncbi:MAG TPA: glutathione S-transferase family protein [Xanthobacteraceae bacterium]|nr:glutathione S-transferase family protein [Xanthobacteraceae bacterium]
MSDFRLYYSQTLNPQKACAVAKHLGSPVEFVRVELGKGEHKTADFTALNPNQKVPVLDIGGRTIWESNAIMCFLARFAGSDLWPQDERQVEVMRWLHWDALHFLPAAGEYYFQYVIKPMFGLGEPDKAALEKASAGFKRYGGVLNEHLKGRRYLAGDTLTIADFAVAVTLPHAKAAHIPVAEFPEIERWHDRLNELPAWREPFPALKAAA